MSASVTYDSSQMMPTRFISHVRLGLQPRIQDHSRNLIEMGGDAGLYPIENLPRILYNAATDPRVVTIALTSLCMLADSYFFYTSQTTHYVHSALDLLPKIPLWAVKFGVYLGTIETIGSLGMRAFGRFSNADLMAKFYTPAASSSSSAASGAAR